MKKFLKTFIIFKIITELDFLREVEVDKNSLLINIEFLVKGRRIIFIR